MKRHAILLLCALSVAAISCGEKGRAAAEPTPTKSVAVTTVKSVLKHVAAAFDETGTFVADQFSDIAPPVAGGPSHSS